MIFNKRIFKRCFCYSKKYWYKNVKEIPLYFKLLHYLVKHGYDEYATWQTFHWFTYTMKDILTTYLDIRQGTPIIVDNYPWSAVTEEDEKIIAKNEEKWVAIVKRMIELLGDMDENNPKYKNYDYMEKDKEMNKAKDEFFKLFAEHFYSLWD